MEGIGVLMMHPIMPYLEEELGKRFNVFKYYDAPDKNAFLSQNAASIRAVVGNTVIGASAELIDKLPNLEIVSTYSVGLDKVDVAKCKERGIKVTNTPDVLTDDVADLFLALIISTLRQICASDRYVRMGLWGTRGYYRLTTKFTGKTVGIVGLGRIGLAIAKRVEAFDCPVIYHSESRKPDVKYKYYVDVVDLAANCDILVLACPLTEETYHIANKAVLDTLGPTGVLVNIGRGPLVDETELVKALTEKRLGGAGLDVFEHEPEVPAELFEVNNVVLLPHVGSSTVETSKVMADLVVQNLEAYALKKPLLTPIC